MLSDQELLNLKRGGESEQVEMKPSTTQGDSIRRAVCAFANDLLGQGNGGVVLIGLHNDGSCAGIEDVDRAQRLLTDWVHSGMILPLPDVEIYCRELEGSPVIVVEVRAHANPPLRYKGQVWVRVGTTNHRSTPEQERRLVERRRGGDRPFDGRPIRGTSMADLDLAYFEREYLPNAVAPQVLEDNQRTMDEQLRALRLLTDGVTNNGGMLHIWQMLSINVLTEVPRASARDRCNRSSHLVRTCRAGCCTDSLAGGRRCIHRNCYADPNEVRQAAA